MGRAAIGPAVNLRKIDRQMHNVDFRRRICD
jgi:hypothetical protein